MIEEREERRGYRRRGEAFWRRALLAQRESGSTQTDFCRRNGLSLSTFQRWRRRIEEAVGESAEAPVTDFVELAIRSEGELLDPEVEVRNETTGFELIFPSGVRLRLPEQVDGRSLAEVLWALEATGRC
ncbi:MAG: hypothetical protein MI919_06945 [Holophagales bacterium]|nr:hypothetical protein [Holophagales bacterium]